MDEYYDKPNGPIKVGFLFSFKSMSMILQRIEEETGDYDQRYPKSELLKIWGNCLLLIFALACLSHSIFIVATGPFIFFYCYVLFQVMRVWKRFKYPRVGMMIATIIGPLLVLVAGFALQGVIFS